jgi:conjugal transfer pilus assembly protein TraD
MSRISPIFHENLFRPIFELNSGMLAFVSGCITALTGGFLSGNASDVCVVLSIYLFIMSARRFSQSVTPLKQQIAMFHNKKIFKTYASLRSFHNKDLMHTYIGEGFEWGGEHSDRAYQIQAMSSSKSEIQMPLLLKSKKKKWDKQTRELGGKAWIHGLGKSLDVTTLNSTFYGHTFIAGSVGTGKTTLLKLLSIGAAIHRDHLTIIVDPKGDRAWREGLKKEMVALGKGHLFYHFNPNKPSESIKIDPIKNWNRSTEIADRLTNLTSSATDGGDPFTDFGWKVINQVVNAMLFIGERVQIQSIYRNLVENKYRLAESALNKHLKDIIGNDYMITHKAQIESYGKSTLPRLLGFYSENYAVSHPEKGVDGAIQLIEHDSGHMMKMTASLLPLFEVLTADPLNELISPVDDLSDEDTRPIVDLHEMVQTGGCLYLSLGSLSDTKTAGHLAKMYLADLAALAGTRYEFHDESTGDPRRVSIFIDEAHAALSGNVSLINLLAQSRGAWTQLFMCTQTIPDLESQTDAATAKRILGLCNNFFSMRCQDDDTQEYVSKQFGKTQISTMGTALMQMGDSSTSLDHYKQSRTETLTKAEGETFPPYLLGDLPILQYMARLSDGRKIKGKIPILID